MAERLAPRMIMRTAMWTLYTGSSLSLLQSFERIEAAFRSDDPAVLSHSRIVWLAMVKLAMDGDVEVTGHFKSTPVSQIIEPGLLVTSHPDYQKHTLRTDVGPFCGVLVQALDTSVPPPTAQPTAKRPQRYFESDQKLVVEMFSMIDGGMAPFAAATELAGRAVGGGTPESKAKRLYNRFIQSRSFTPN